MGSPNRHSLAPDSRRQSLPTSARCNAPGFLERTKRPRKDETSGTFTSFARTDCARQPAVINSVSRVPQRLTQFDSATKDFNFVRTARRGIGGYELLVLLGDEVFIMTVPQDSLKYVLALAHKINFPVHAWTAFPTSRPILFLTWWTTSLGHIPSDPV